MSATDEQLESVSIDKNLLELFSVYACKTENKAEKASLISKVIQEKAQGSNEGSIDSQSTKQTLMLILDLASSRFIEALVKVGYFQKKLFTAE